MRTTRTLQPLQSPIGQARMCAPNVARQLFSPTIFRLRHMSDPNIRFVELRLSLLTIPAYVQFAVQTSNLDGGCLSTCARPFVLLRVVRIALMSLHLVCFLRFLPSCSRNMLLPIACSDINADTRASLSLRARGPLRHHLLLIAPTKRLRTKTVPTNISVKRFQIIPTCCKAAKVLKR